jgi:hypothetical protein
MATLTDFRVTLADFIRGKPKRYTYTSRTLQKFVREVDAKRTEPSAKLVEMYRSAGKRHDL